MKTILLFLCFALVAPAPLFAVDLPAPPAKKVNITLKDGRSAAEVNGRLLITENGKLAPAPPGSYVAANGKVWTVDAAGHVHSSASASSVTTALSSSSAVRAPLQPAPTSQTEPPQAAAKVLKNVPAALKGLKIFLPAAPGTTLDLLRIHPPGLQKLGISTAASRSSFDESPQGGGTATKIVLSATQPVIDSNNDLEFAGGAGIDYSGGRYPYVLCFHAVSARETQWVSGVDLHLATQAGGYLLIDISLGLDWDLDLGSNPTTDQATQILVEFPGNSETFPATPPDPNDPYKVSHIVFGYYAGNSSAVTTFDVSAINPADDQYQYLFYSVTVTRLAADGTQTQ